MHTIGKTGLQISPIGFGAAPLGNLYAPLDDQTARETGEAAIDAGLRYVDTAPYYGFGLSERRVGDIVRGRDPVVVSTKVGRLLVPDADVRDDRERSGFRSAMPFRAVFDYGYDAIMRSFEASLHRMGLARVDLLYIHDIGRLTHGDAHAHHWRQLVDGGGLRALETLRADGAIAGFGVGVNEIAVCLELMAETQLDAILLAGRYTLLEQEALDALLPACAAAGTSIVVGGPYNSGILATGVGGPGPHRYDYGPAPRDVIAKVAAIETVATRHDVALAAAALRFPLAHPQVASVIPGLDSPQRVREAAAFHAAVIPHDFWRELKAEGLLRADAPTPADAA